MSVRQRVWKFIADAWRFISDADTAVSIFGFVGVGMSPLFAIALSTWAYFEGAPTPAVVIIFLVALLVLLSITYQGARLIDFWKNRRANELRERYLDTESTEEKGFLDFIVEGNQALKDITKIIIIVGKETERLGRQIGRHARRVDRTNDLGEKRKKIEAAANTMSLYSLKLTDLSNDLRKVTKAFRNNLKNFILQAKIQTDKEKQDLTEFIDAIKGVKANVPKTREELSAFRKTTMSLMGVSGQLNVASQRQGSAIGRMIKNIDAIDRVFDELILIGEQKAKEVGV